MSWPKRDTLQAVQEDKEAADEGTDADAVERRRVREAEEWRLKQLRSGVSSQANSNFQVRHLAAQGACLVPLVLVACLSLHGALVPLGVPLGSQARWQAFKPATWAWSAPRSLFLAAPSCGVRLLS